MHDPVTYRRIHGSCHCGNIRVTLDWPDPGSAIPVRACGCGLCTKHRAAWTSHPDGRFHLRVTDHSRVTRYRFGTKTADFHVCVTCGVIPRGSSCVRCPMRSPPACRKPGAIGTSWRTVACCW